MVTSRRGAGTNGFMKVGTLGTPNSSRKITPPSSRYGESRKPSPIRMTALVSTVWCVMTARRVLPQIATSSERKPGDLWTMVAYAWQSHTSYTINLYGRHGHECGRAYTCCHNSLAGHAACWQTRKPACAMCAWYSSVFSSIPGYEAHSQRRSGRSSRLQMGSAAPPTPHRPAPTGSPGSAQLL